MSAELYRRSCAVPANASMAAVLLCAGHEGKRSGLPHSRVMIHQPLSGAQGQASDIEIAAQEVLKIKDMFVRLVSCFDTEILNLNSFLNHVNAQRAIS